MADTELSIRDIQHGRKVNFDQESLHVRHRLETLRYSIRLTQIRSIATLWPQPNCPGQCQTWLSQLGPRRGIIITQQPPPPARRPAANVCIGYISAISRRNELKFCMIEI